MTTLTPWTLTFGTPKPIPKPADKPGGQWLRAHYISSGRNEVPLPEDCRPWVFVADVAAWNKEIEDKMRRSRFYCWAPDSFYA